MCQANSHKKNFWSRSLKLDKIKHFFKRLYVPLPESGGAFIFLHDVYQILIRSQWLQRSITLDSQKRRSIPCWQTITDFGLSSSNSRHTTWNTNVCPHSSRHISCRWLRTYWSEKIKAKSLKLPWKDSSTFFNSWGLSFYCKVSHGQHL